MCLIGVKSNLVNGRLQDKLHTRSNDSFCDVTGCGFYWQELTLLQYEHFVMETSGSSDLKYWYLKGLFHFKMYTSPLFMVCKTALLTITGVKSDPPCCKEDTVQSAMILQIQLCLLWTCPVKVTKMRVNVYYHLILLIIFNNELCCSWSIYINLPGLKCDKTPWREFTSKVISRAVKGSSVSDSSGSSPILKDWKSKGKLRKNCTVQQWVKFEQFASCLLC